MEPGSAQQVVQPNGVATSSNSVDVTSDSGMLKESQDGAHAAHTSAQEVSTVSNQAAKSLDDPQKQPGPNAKGPPLVVKLAVASLGVSTLFYVMLFIYLGASSNQTAYTQNIHVAVANFDTGMVGQAFMQFASNVPAGNGLPSLQVCTESCAVNKFTRHNGDLHFPQRPTCFHPPLPHQRGAQAITGSSPSDLTNRVGNGEFWAALYVAPGTSSSLMAAIGAANPNAYQPSRCHPRAHARQSQRPSQLRAVLT